LGQFVVFSVACVLCAWWAIVRDRWLLAVLALLGATVRPEVVLLPLRSDFGMIDRVIGCLHPIEASTRKNAESLLRFKIDKMSVETIRVTAEETDLPTPIEAFAEPSVEFQHADPKPGATVHRLSAIDGGLSHRSMEIDEDRSERSRSHLRVVKD
jgi:hypothetical protein